MVVWEIRSAAAKGLGVFAKTFIPRGTRIFSERPLLAIRQDQDASDIYAASKLISQQDKQGLLTLSAHITKESAVLRWNQALWCIFKQNISDISQRLRGNGTFSISGPSDIREHVTINSIFRSNAFNLGHRSHIQQAVFPRISRINHSCIPNAQGNFHEVLGCFNVHATRDIDLDEELTLNYLNENGDIRAARQLQLLDDFGFVCECPACDMTTSKATDWEESRVQMRNALHEFGELAAETGIKNPEMELRTIQQFIRLLESQGIYGRELSTLYLEAANLNKTLGHSEDALSCAEKGLKVDEECLGVDNPMYQDTLEIVEEIRSSI